MPDIAKMTWLLLAISAIDGGLVAGEAVPRFKQDIIPLLNDHCVACHLLGSEPGGLSFTPDNAYDNLVDKPSLESPLRRVKSGSPDESYLVRKIEGTHLAAGGSGASMPLGGPPLDKRSVALIRAWIGAGAPNN